MKSTLTAIVAIFMTMIFCASAWADSANKNQNPSDEAILKWLSVEPSEVNIVKRAPIFTHAGEAALLVSLVFEHTRNQWGGYALVRPKLKQAKRLDYGGQFNGITVIDAGYEDGTPSVVIIGSASSGQGQTLETQHVVTFSDWQVKKRYETDTYSDNSGVCGEGIVCVTSQTFLNLVGIEPLRLAVTNVHQSGKTPDTMTIEDVSVEVVTVPEG